MGGWQGQVTGELGKIFVDVYRLVDKSWRSNAQSSCYSQ